MLQRVEFPQGSVQISLTPVHDDDEDDDDDDENDAYHGVYDDDLYIMCVVNGWIDISSDEIGVVGEPAHKKQRNHPHHHFDNLK